MRALLRVALIGLAVLFVLLSIIELNRVLAGRAKTTAAGVFVLGVFASCAGACGYGALRLGKREAPSVQVIRAVKANDGRITAAQLVAATNLAWDEARNELDRLRAAGACELLPGGNIYRFAEFETRKPS
jgi:hypothetical protein